MFEALEKLYKKSGRVYKRGSVIFLENEIGDEMYLILEGTVQISKQYKEYEFIRDAKLKIGSDVQVLANLTKGDFFGEMALINNEPRAATAVAIEDVKLIVIKRDLFEKIIKESKELLYQILKSLSNRLREANRYMRIIPQEEQLPLVVYKTPKKKILIREEKKESETDYKRILCIYCKADIENRDIFCWKCGKKIDTLK
ncbi:MAG: cyclic nucleotide-binding domain-containing protein [Candidatus Hydrogenedentota bacterium]